MNLRCLEILENIINEKEISATDLAERLNILIYEILSSNKECSYSDLIDKLRVSKTTISSDIRKVKEYLKNFNLKY